MPDDSATTRCALNGVLIGGTGLVGAQLVELSRDCPSLHLSSLARRAGTFGAADFVPLDFERLLEAPETVLASALPEGADVAISCLGTTIRKAGSEAAMWRIDHDYVLAFARGARAAGARQFILMSSVGAGGRGFYLRMKGAIEDAVAALAFERLDIIRPGLLLGDRPDRRFAEQLGQALAPALNPLLRGSLSRYQALPGKTVALALLALAGKPQPGRFVHENDALRRLAGG